MISFLTGFLVKPILLISYFSHTHLTLTEPRFRPHPGPQLNTLNLDIDGCTPDKPGYSNPMDPNDPNSAEIPMTWNAVYEQSDPCHSTSCSTNQVFGFNDENEANNEPNMRGFLKSTLR